MMKGSKASGEGKGQGKDVVARLKRALASCRRVDARHAKKRKRCERTARGRDGTRAARVGARRRRGASLVVLPKSVKLEDGGEQSQAGRQKTAAGRRRPHRMVRIWCSSVRPI